MLQWVSADLKTGKILADLPSLDVDYPLTSTLSNVDTATAHLNLSGAPENWDRATTPRLSLLACYDDTATSAGGPGAIQWAGYVRGRHRDAATSIIDLAVETLEGYPDRRYVGDTTWEVGTGWRDIVASIVSANVVTGTLPGIDNLALNAAVGGATLTEELVWQNADNVTVIGRINELIGQFGGEFHITWAWSTDGQMLIPTLNFGDRIGQAAPANLGPAVTFDFPGIISALVMDEDYSPGAGANVVTAYSSGQGSYTPYSSPQQATDMQGAPAFEARVSPVASVTSASRLNAYAQQAAAYMNPGAQTISLTYSREKDTGRKYGLDWGLGDDVGYDIADSDVFPGGMSGTGRVVAVDVSPDVVTPVFAQPTTYGG